MKKNKNKNKKKKGFTLIELLAVIVILGLLMAIAIPSVTKYITQSRKKTVTTTIGNYINSLVNEVNDLNYSFTGSNTIYAVPIECISLERGGTNPFGEWYQASNAYWAYVLVQYDDTNSKYIYGYTFKDSAGYGLYPTIQAKLKESGSQIKTGLELSRPESGLITTITNLDNWKNSGFEVDENTQLVVLEAGSEGEIGDGKETCTLAQKGSNYSQVEEEKKMLLTNLIKRYNPIITTAPTLTASSNNTSDASGLYVSNETTNGQPTYYFRGKVENNYVSFAGQTWRVVRINEDGTIRLIMQNGINNNSIYKINTVEYNYKYMYYSEGNMAQPTIEAWYESNLKDYDNYIATGTFCEQAKVKWSSDYTSGNATMDIYTSYTPNFRCATDENGKGIVRNKDGTLVKIGFITYDEAIHAGGYYDQANSSYYLYNGYYFWTMSPAGFITNRAYALGWLVSPDGHVGYSYVNGLITLRPVINLDSKVKATGTGTSTDPYIIQTN